MNRRRSSKTVFSIAVVLALVASTRAPALSQPSLSLAPAAGPAGTAVTVTGTNFERHCPVDVFVGSTANDPLASGVPVSQSGTFSTTITIPSDLEAGEHEIIARGVAKRKNRNCLRPTPTQASATYTVEEPGSEPYDRTIYLAQRALDDPGIDETFLEEIRASEDPTHAIVQFEGLPERGQLDAIREVGIRPLDYLNGEDGAGTAYLASISPAIDPENEIFRELVRAVQRLEPIDKHSLTLDASAEVLDALVVFFEDIEHDDALATLRDAGVGEPNQIGPRTYEVSISGEQVDVLGAEESVQWIQENPERQLALDDSRYSTGVEGVQQFSPSPTPTYNGLSGEGTQIAIFDSGVDDLHPDLADRVIRQAPPNTDGNGNRDYHGTFVASIAAGSGYQSDKTNDFGDPNGGHPYEWRGMAPESEIAAYSTGHAWEYPEMSEAIKEYGVEVTNHSYTWDIFGRYEWGGIGTDEIIAGGLGQPPFNVRDDAYTRPAVLAGGNNALEPSGCTGDAATDGDDCPTAYHAGYFSVRHACKNCIVATALGKENGEPSAPDVQPRPSDLLHLPYAGIGPTLDGRLKPDVGAVADFIRSAGPSNGYMWGGATSGATPAVSGIIALMYEQHLKKQATEHFFLPFWPSAVKAILVQSAVDLVGTDPTINFDTGQPVKYGVGPDFVTGYGLVDARSAIRMVEKRQFDLGGVSEEDPDMNHVVEVTPGQRELRVTVAWDDPPGSPNQSDAARKIVNDLDLTLKGPNGEIRRPLVLPTLRPKDCVPSVRGVQVGTCPGKDDPNQNYFGPAKPGVDKLNNVEQVVIKDPPPGKWIAHVSALQGHRPGLKLPGTSDDVRLPQGGEQMYVLATGTPERPDLHIAMTDDPDSTAAGGGPVTYGITVTNNGAATAVGARVVDTLPPGLNFVSSTGSCDTDPNEALTCALGDLAPGEQRTLDVVAEVSPSFGYNSYPPTVKNRARASSLVPDDDPSDNVALEETTVTYAADTEMISLDITGNPATFVGEETTAVVTMAIGNNGPASPVDPVVTVTASTSPGAGVSPTSATIPTEGVSSEDTHTVWHEITLSCLKKGVQTVTVSAAVAPASPVTDPNSGNNSRSTTAQVLCVPKGPTEL